MPNRIEVERRICELEVIVSLHPENKEAAAELRRLYIMLEDMELAA